MTVRKDVPSIKSIRDFTRKLDPHSARWIC